MRRFRANWVAQEGVLHAPGCGRLAGGGAVTKWSPEHHWRCPNAAAGEGMRWPEQAGREGEGKGHGEVLNLTLKAMERSLKLGEVEDGRK